MNKTEKVVFISKQGVKTVMPSLVIAVDYAEGIWKEFFDRIEVQTTYKADRS